jgi:hypothetical protein
MGVASETEVTVVASERNRNVIVAVDQYVDARFDASDELGIAMTMTAEAYKNTAAPFSATG